MRLVAGYRFLNLTRDRYDRTTALYADLSTPATTTSQWSGPWSPASPGTSVLRREPYDDESTQQAYVIARKL
jgi:hypothetical protein